ncbi:MAG: WbqC family protein [Aestuariivita sp.]|uniref:WbqC family protein n=1 Tax=Aestuariivita sp. TaxID=1872407 RepID=UPI003BB042C1
MTRVVISQPMYFPWVGFLAQMALADVMIWLDDAQFSKGSFTNRVQVPRATDQPTWMSIPLEGKGHNTRICDLKPANDAWRNSHLALLRNTYRQEPFGQDALNLATDALSHSTLCDVMIASCRAEAQAVGVSPPDTYLSSEMNVAATGSNRVLELVKAVSGTEYVTGHGARNYLDHNAFEAEGLTVSYMAYNPLPWHQINPDFTPFVTGLDLIAAIEPDKRYNHLNPDTVTWRSFLGTKG